MIEIGHIYYEDIKQKKFNIEKLKKELECIKSISSKQLYILIDDKEYELTDEQKKECKNEIEKIYKEMNMMIENIFFERDFITDVHYLENKLKTKREFFRKEKKHVFYFLCQEEKIPFKTIKDGKVYYSCQTLATLWTLKKIEMNSGKKIWTILEKKYEKVEQQVDMLLKEIKIEFENERIWIE